MEMSLKLYAIIGVKNLFDDLGLSTMALSIQQMCSLQVSLHFEPILFRTSTLEMRSISNLETIIPMWL